MDVSVDESETPVSVEPERLSQILSKWSAEFSADEVCVLESTADDQQPIALQALEHHWINCLKCYRRHLAREYPTGDAGVLFIGNVRPIWHQQRVEQSMDEEHQDVGAETSVAENTQQVPPQGDKLADQKKMVLTKRKIDVQDTTLNEPAQVSKQENNTIRPEEPFYKSVQILRNKEGLSKSEATYQLSKERAMKMKQNVNATETKVPVSSRDQRPWAPPVLHHSKQTSQLTKDEQKRFVAMILSLSRNKRLRFQGQQAEYNKLVERLKDERMIYKHFAAGCALKMSNQFEALTMGANEFVEQRLLHKASEIASVLSATNYNLIEDEFLRHISLDPGRTQNLRTDVNLELESTLLNVGKLPKLVLPDQRFKAAISFDLTTIAKKYPVHDSTQFGVKSDTNIAGLLKKHSADFVVSAGTLRLLIVRRSLSRNGQWDIPIHVTTTLSKGRFVRIVYFLKPLPSRQMNRMGKQWLYCKYGLKTKVVDKKFEIDKAHQYSSTPVIGELLPQSPTASTLKIDESTKSPTKKSLDGGESSKRIAVTTGAGAMTVFDDILARMQGGDVDMKQKEETEGRSSDACESADEYESSTKGGRLRYSLWTLGDYRLLVRSNQDGFVKASSIDVAADDGVAAASKATTVNASILPKVEYLAQFGAERLTDSEWLWHHLTAELKEADVHEIVRIGRRTSDMVGFESVLTNERRTKSLPPDRKLLLDGHLRDLSTLLEAISKLDDGDYLLQSRDNSNKLTIFKATDRENEAHLRLLDQYSADTNRRFTMDSELPPADRRFNGVDETVLLVWHRVQSRVPATFPPFIEHKPQPTEPKVQKKRKSKKAKQKERQQEAKKEEDTAT